MSKSNNFFPEIQGLRAVAVLTVILFHVNHAWLTGGYVGVDVFFVISGFVITASLIREATKCDQISIPLFYIRRVRRLLPAAGVVLCFVVMGTYIFLPRGDWFKIGFEVIASSFYFENWVLFFDVTNYLTQEEADSPIVHYWSLSIEEQFYFIWPILIFFLVKFSTKLTWKRNLLVVISLVFFSSLLFSIIFTSQSPQQGYFSSFTRVWELALGAILAIIVWRPNVLLGNVLSILGLTMIISASMIYSEFSNYPGYLALLPTFGAAAIILAATSKEKLTLLMPLRVPFMLYTGNISYSLYLWHWPLIVFANAISKDEISSLQRVFVLVISFILAGISTYLLEDPFRKGRFKVSKVIQAATLAFITISAPVMGGAYLMLLSKQVNLRYEDLGFLPGARALKLATYEPQESFNVETYRPRPELARKDLREAYARKCVTGWTDDAINLCVFDSVKSEIRIGLIGDSHAGQWEPALVKACETKNCNVTSITKGLCPLSSAKFVFKKQLNESCISRHPKLLQEIKEQNFDIIITSQFRRYSIYGGKSKNYHYERMVEGLIDTWSDLSSLGAEIIVIADTPYFGKNLAKCMESKMSNFEECTHSLENEEILKDPLIKAANLYDGVKLINMESYICPEQQCYPVIGDVLVWRDGNHMTRTYSETLAEDLYSEMGFK